jgi:NitT/TauT family transport system substrate-binding protein
VLRRSCFIPLLLLALLASCNPTDQPQTSAPQATDPVSAVGTQTTTAPVATATATSIPLIPVRLTMGYRPDVQFAPLYVAATNGHYEDAGLDVEFVHLPETDAVQLVGVNEIQFAIVSGEQVLLARNQGLPIIYVMAWWQDNPIGVAAPVAGGIQNPEDLVGKSVGFPGQFAASYIGLRALLNATGVSEEAINLDPIGYTQVESLLAGREDAVVIYVNNEPVQLAAQGMDVHVMRVADYVRLPGNGLITNEATLRDNPDLVRAMVEATLKGLQDTINDPDAAFEICKQYVEGLAEANQTVLRQVLAESIKFWEADRLGYSAPEAWDNIQEVLLEMGLLEEAQDMSQAFSNAYIP